jgi:hypothetical protein
MADTRAIRRLGRTACAGITGSGVPGAAIGRNARIIVRGAAGSEAGQAPPPSVPAVSEERAELVDRVILVRVRRHIPES